MIKGTKISRFRLPVLFIALVPYVCASLFAGKFVSYLNHDHHAYGSHSHYVPEVEVDHAVAWHDESGHSDQQPSSEHNSYPVDTNEINYNHTEDQNLVTIYLAANIPAQQTKIQTPTFIEITPLPSTAMAPPSWVSSVVKHESTSPSSLLGSISEGQSRLVSILLSSHAILV